MKWIPTVGRMFTADRFPAYLKSLGAPPAFPKFCVLHNTAVPNLDHWTKTSGPRYMKGAAAYYQGLGWHAGPHLFCAPEGIWVFTPLGEPGIHSPSWNGCSWGIEQIGDYEVEAYNTGDGAKVAHNAVCAAAALSVWKGLDSTTIRFHKEDPKTTHKGCPGVHCVKAEFVQRVHDEIVRLKA